MALAVGPAASDAIDFAPRSSAVGISAIQSTRRLSSFDVRISPRALDGRAAGTCLLL
jgi:hypothetical protein